MIWSISGDHALIDINKLLGLNPKQVTVRTKSRDSQSSDSVPTPIPSNVLKGKLTKVIIFYDTYVLLLAWVWYMDSIMDRTQQILK